MGNTHWVYMEIYHLKVQVELFLKVNYFRKLSTIFFYLLQIKLFKFSSKEPIDLKKQSTKILKKLTSKCIQEKQIAIQIIEHNYVAISNSYIQKLLGKPQIRIIKQKFKIKRTKNPIKHPKRINLLETKIDGTNSKF